jgi:hypothetical protein
VKNPTNRLLYAPVLWLAATLVAVACGDAVSSDAASDGASGAAGMATDNGGAAGSENAGLGGDSGLGGEGASTEGGIAGAGGDTATPASACGSRCESGATCCGGECIELDSDAENCGACGAVCDAPHATAECVASECVIAKCSAGYVDCNQSPRDGCEARDTRLPGAPALASPTLGAYTGSVRAESSLQPRFRWAAASVAGSCDAVTYELELDDSCPTQGFQGCDFPSPEVREAGIADVEWSPSEALPVADTTPVGTRYFWRVRACETSERCTDWSAVRYLDVGRLRDDLNGDGYSDIFALSADNDTVFRSYVVSGGAKLPTQPTRSLISGLDWYSDARWVGDVNGDGFADLLRVVSFEAPTLFLGGADIASLQGAQLPSTGTPASWSGAGAGDWNGDGYADLIVAEYSTSAPSQGEAVGVAHIYLGNRMGIPSGPIDVRPPTGTTAVEFGAALEGGTDIDGDGLPDAFVLDGDEGRIHAIYGSASGLARVNASFTTGAPCHYYDRAMLAGAGDLNGDGFGDLAALCPSGVLVYLGARTPALTPSWSATLGQRYATLAGGYDLGGDGYADLLIGASDAAASCSPCFRGPPSSRVHRRPEALPPGRMGLQLQRGWLSLPIRTGPFRLEGFSVLPERGRTRA